MKKESILGVKVCVIPKDRFIQRIEEDIRKDRQRFIVAINPEKLLKAKKDEALTNLLNGADYPIPDGVGVLVAARLKKIPIKERITGIDCMEMLCASSADHGFRVFLYGAKPTVAERTKAVLEQRYPGIQIAGCLDGYCTDNEMVIKQINATNPDIVFVALGSPKQEYWIAKNRSELHAKILQGVGGSFDVISGNLKRAPDFFREHGLEWLFRLLQQPKRIWRVIKMSRFLFLLLKD